MVEELFVVTVFKKYSGTRGIFGSKDEAVAYAQQAVTDPDVEQVEVRVHNTLDLINAALDELEDAAREDEEVENGELVELFQ